MPNLEFLKSILNYDSTTGKFYYKEKRGSRAAGDEAGYVHKTKRYRYISVYGTRIFAHRLVWLFETGSLPFGDIDHVDHDRDNNKLSNLRDTTNQKNHENMSMFSNNTSGVTGIGWHKAKGKWRAYITIQSKMKHLGLFSDKEEAIKARKMREKYYGFHDNHGK